MRFKIFTADDYHPRNLAELEKQVNEYVEEKSPYGEVEVQWMQSSAPAPHKEGGYVVVTITAIVTTYE